MSKYLRFLLPLFIFLGLVGFLFKGLFLDPREVPSPLIDKPAPAFTLSLLDKPDTTFKRDDMLGLFPGGNKTRKLEYLVGPEQSVEPRVVRL